jgi:hypothetical protein
LQKDRKSRAVSLQLSPALYGITMKYSSIDYNILSYVLKKNFMSYRLAIDWAYRQYTDQGIDPFIEKISQAGDVAEIRELISNEYQVYGEPTNEFLAGETAKAYAQNKLSLHIAISRIIFDLDLSLPEEERQELYIAEDYFGWHDNAENKAFEHVKPLFSKYRAAYENAIAKFSV